MPVSHVLGFILTPTTCISRCAYHKPPYQYCKLSEPSSGMPEEHVAGEGRLFL